MASNIEIRTLIVNGLPSEMEQVNQFLYTVIDEDQVMNMVCGSDGIYALVLHGPSYLQTAIQQIDGKICQDKKITCRIATSEEQAQVLGTIPKVRNPKPDPETQQPHQSQQPCVQDLVKMLQALTPEDKNIIMQALQTSQVTSCSTPNSSVPVQSSAASPVSTYTTPGMSTGPTSVPGCTQWWSTNPAGTYNQSPRLAGPASLPGGVGEPFSTQYWPPVNPTGSFSSYNQPPRLTYFSGEKNKGEVSYSQWRYEVDGLVRDGFYPEQLILQAIRRSLRGYAADVLRHMGPVTRIQPILEKMNLVFGNILPKHRLIEHFCLSQQKETETVAEWGCRLEDMLSQLKEKDNISSMNQATMLRERFFHGLFSDKVKTCLRHLFDRGESYEQLLLSGRSAELEYSKQGKSSKASISSIQQTIPSNIELSKKLDSLIDGMNSLKSKVRALEDNKFSQQSKAQDQHMLVPLSFIKVLKVSTEVNSGDHVPHQDRFLKGTVTTVVKLDTSKVIVL